MSGRTGFRAGLGVAGVLAPGLCVTRGIGCGGGWGVEYWGPAGGGGLRETNNRLRNIGQKVRMRGAINRFLHTSARRGASLSTGIT